MRRWEHIVNVTGPFHNDLSFKEKRDMIVAVFKGLPHYDEDDCDSDLWWILDELADTRDEDEFDTVWDGLYDWCDSNSVWIETNNLGDIK